MKKIIECDILKEQGYIVIESSKNENLEDYPELEVVKVKDFKITKIIILQKI